MASFHDKSADTHLLQGGTAKFSSSGSLIAAVAGSKIALYRNTSPVERIHIFACIDKIEYFDFSPDESFLLCALYARNCVQVFSTTDFNWKCRINEGPAGMISASWVPDSQSLITESDFGIQLSVWSLVDNSQSVITFPKPVTKMHSAMATFNRTNSSTIAFSDNRRFLAVVHRIELQDHIGVYSLNPLLEVTKFRARTSDVAMVQWLPYDTHLITIDSPLHYKCAIYSPSGEMLTCFEAYQNALGIRCLGIFRPPYFHTLSAVESGHIAVGNGVGGAAAAVAADAVVTTSNLIAVGSFDSKIRLMTMFTWQVVMTLPLIHPRDMDVGFFDSANHNAPVVTKVELSKIEQRDLIEVISLESLTQASASKGSHSTSTTGTNITPSMLSPYVTRMVKLLPKSSTVGAATATVAETVPTASSAAGGASKTAPGGATTKPSSSANNNIIAVTSAVDGVALPAMGVHWIHWSASRELLAASDEAYARCIWIWRPLEGKLVDLLIQLDNVTSAAWRPWTLKSSKRSGDAESVAITTSTGEPTGGGDEHPSSMTDLTTTRLHQSALQGGGNTSTADAAAAAAAPVTPQRWEEDVLAFACHGQHVYLWSPSGGIRKVEVVSSHEATRMRIRSVEWSADGETLLLRGKELFATVRVSSAGDVL